MLGFCMPEASETILGMINCRLIIPVLPMDCFIRQTEKPRIWIRIWHTPGCNAPAETGVATEDLAFLAFDESKGRAFTIAEGMKIFCAKPIHGTAHEEFEFRLSSIEALLCEEDDIVTIH